MLVAIIIVVVVVAIALPLGLGVATVAGRRRRLRKTYGPEYDRALAEHDDRRAAERDLSRRLDWYRELGIVTLEPEARDRFAQEWAGVQEKFVDMPATALRDADGLVTAVLAGRRFPVDDPGRRDKALSVEYGEVLGGYRTATQQLSRTSARREDPMGREDGDDVSTEDMRLALIAYRSMFSALIGVASSPGGTPAIGLGARQANTGVRLMDRRTAATRADKEDRT